MLVRFFLFFAITIFSCYPVAAQERVDTLPPPLVIDTSIQEYLPLAVDTLPRRDLLWQPSISLADTSSDSKLVFVEEKKEGVYRTKEDLDAFFYVLAGMFLLFAVLRQTFAKYYGDMFRLFFRTTLKQRQLREQIVQAALPGALSLVFFFITGGFYAAQMLFHYGWVGQDDFWMYALYSSLGLIVIYSFKFLSVKAMGWVLDVESTADAYNFLILVFNRMIGIFLLPFLVLLTYLQENVYTAALWISWIGLSLFYLYRFILAFRLVRNHIKINLFHFFLYVLALEIIPLLLIYKALILVFG